MKRFALGLGLFALGFVYAACGGTSPAESSGTAGTGASSSTGSGGNSGSGGNVGLVCDPACSAPQFCSSVGTCLDPGKCAGDSDCGSGTICDMMTSSCVPGGGCAADEIKADPIPPNLLIVLDRSCSMTQMVGGKTKWDIAVDAINKMTTTYAGKIRFGLTLFPDLVTPQCGQDVIPIPVAPNTEMDIQMLLTNALKAADKYFPDGPCVTNIDTAMEQAATEPAFNDMMRDSYALLLTDGQQAGCNAAGGDPGTTTIITDLYAKRKVATFVLGFGGAVDPAQMNIFADAGGVPSGDPMTHYYKAEDQMSLDAALGAIADKTLGCSFTLQSNPSDASQIDVFFNNDPKGVPQDTMHMDGWDYDKLTNKITFYGPACDMLKAGTVTDVDIVVACGVPTPD